LRDVLQTVIAKNIGVLRRHSMLPGEEPTALLELTERAPALAAVQADSIGGRRLIRIGVRLRAP